MSPFRNKPVKWTGDDNSCYKNNGGYKYDIVNKTIVKRAEDMPACYLADTLKEAEYIYSQFEHTLNELARSYSINTGLNKADLFSEGLIGLGRAYRDWDPDRSDNFKTYAIYRIKDSLGEFVRNNSSTVSVPSYIKKAYANLREIKSICEAAEIDYDAVAEKQELPDGLDVADAVRCAELISNLINAANRAKIKYCNFLDRLTLIPEDVEYIEQAPPEVHQRKIEMLEAAVVVEKLKEYMDKEELAICDGIMLDKSYAQIGKELGRSKSWVSGKLKKLKERILIMVRKDKS